MLAAVCLLMPVEAAAPAPAGACPTDREGVERAVRSQTEADAELDAGRPARGAALLGEVAEAYPECRPYHSRRMMAIQRALAAHRAAFDADAQPRHLEEALARVDRYLESLRAAYGDHAVQTTGHVRLSEARAALLADMPAPTPPPPEVRIPEDASERARRPERSAEPTPPTPPAGSPGRGLRIGGGLAIGGGAIFLVVAIAGAARAAALERQIEDAGCTASLAGPCAELDLRGHAANRTGVTGVVGASILTVTGVVLVTAGVRRRIASLSLAPALHPRFVGLSFQGHF